jgi:DNA-binding NarL/FixJ family response regulator
MIRILIADDHDILRAGLKHILQDSGDIVVAGEASDGHQALAQVRAGHWDAVVLDLSMPGKSGIELIKQIKGEFPKLPILILSMHKEDLYAVRALKAGASGYLTKESAPEDLVAAIRKVAAGGKYVTPALGERLALDLEDSRGAPTHEVLSDREYQIMWMIVSGKALTQIGQELGLSPNTISTYRARILRKMGMKNNAELLHYAIQHHLVS